MLGIQAVTCVLDLIGSIHGGDTIRFRIVTEFLTSRRRHRDRAANDPTVYLLARRVHYTDRICQSATTDGATIMVGIRRVGGATRRRSLALRAPANISGKILQFYTE